MGLDERIRGCDRCADLLRKHPENPPDTDAVVMPKPILSDSDRAPIMLVGQAPGLTEYRTGRPFSGDAGREVKALFSDCGIPSSEFNHHVCQTSAVKCYPGRRPNKARWEDRPPCARMLESCSGFLQEQIAAVQPKLIVALGGVAAQSLAQVGDARRRKLTLADLVGTAASLGGAEVVHLFHLSPSNRALNDSDNRNKQAKATSLIRSAIADLGLTRKTPAQ